MAIRDGFVSPSALEVMLRKPRVEAATVGKGLLRAVRFYVASIPSSNNNGMVMCTELRTSPTISGLVGIAESQNANYPKTMLVDGGLGYSPGTWGSTTHTTGQTTWWGVLLPSPQNVSAIEMYCNEAIGSSYRPYGFDIQVSYDTTTGSDGTWVTVLSGQTYSTFNVWQSYALG